MILRYTYFSTSEDIIDQEPLIDKLPADKVKWLSKEELYKKTAFIESIWPFNTKYEKIPLVAIDDSNTEYDVKFYFTEDEYKILQKDAPLLVPYLLILKDRLALDENGNLYDIDEDQPKTFTWYSFGIIAYFN